MRFFKKWLVGTKAFPLTLRPKKNQSCSNSVNSAPAFPMSNPFHQRPLSFFSTVTVFLPFMRKSYTADGALTCMFLWCKLWVDWLFCICDLTSEETALLGYSVTRSFSLENGALSLCFQLVIHVIVWKCHWFGFNICLRKIKQQIFVHFFKVSCKLSVFGYLLWKL